MKLCQKTTVSASFSAISDALLALSSHHNLLDYLFVVLAALLKFSARREARSHRQPLHSGFLTHIERHEKGKFTSNTDIHHRHPALSCWPPASNRLTGLIANCLSHRQEKQSLCIAVLISDYTVLDTQPYHSTIGPAVNRHRHHHIALQVTLSVSPI